MALARTDRLSEMVLSKILRKAVHLSEWTPQPGEMPCQARAFCLLEGGRSEGVWEGCPGGEGLWETQGNGYLQTIQENFNI